MPRYQPRTAAARLQDRSQVKGGQRAAGCSSHSHREKLFGRVSGKGLTELRQGGSRIGDDDLKSTGLGNRPLDNHSGSAPFHRLSDERMTVVTGPPDGDKHLPGIEPAAIRGASRDLKILATHEASPGEQSSQADRRDSLLGQSVDEPSSHRRASMPAILARPPFLGCRFALIVACSRPLKPAFRDGRQVGQLD